MISHYFFPRFYARLWLNSSDKSVLRIINTTTFSLKFKKNIKSIIRICMAGISEELNQDIKLNTNINVSFISQTQISSSKRFNFLSYVTYIQICHVNRHNLIKNVTRTFEVFGKKTIEPIANLACSHKNMYWQHKHMGFSFDFNIFASILLNLINPD